MGRSDVDRIRQCGGCGGRLESVEAEPVQEIGSHQADQGQSFGRVEWLEVAQDVTAQLGLEAETTSAPARTVDDVQGQQEHQEHGDEDKRNADAMDEGVEIDTDPFGVVV